MTASVHPAGNSPIAPLMSRLRPQLLVGLLTMAFFFGGIGYWAVTAPIHGAAISSGTVSTEKSRRTIQHLEGGVIKEILVQDGDTVTEGQHLVLLDDTRARATVEQQALLIDTFQAELERLRQEASYLMDRDLSRDLVFSEELTTRATEEQGAREILNLHQTHYNSRQASLRASQDLTQQTIRGYVVQIEGLERELESLDRQLKLLVEEGEVLQSMRSRGLERRATIAENLINQTQTEQVRHEREGKILSLKESINQSVLENEDLWASELEKTTDEILSVAQSLLDAQTTYAAYLDTLERTVITAPVSGILIELSVNTEGAVIEAGETVVEIVPNNEPLMLETRVDPNDIDVVVPGLSASIVLLAYPRRNLPKIYGTLESISADSLVDSATGESYYLARVKIEREEIERLGEDVSLVPGMSVEVFLQTPARTFIDYLFEPFLRYGDRAFRET